MWEVNQWGSHPDEGNDDCWCGDDFDTEEEARESLAADLAVQGEHDEWLELVGPGIQEVYHQKGRSGPAQEETCTEWAMLQGMSHGVDAYNEAIGSPLETDNQ
tara:strand:- start:259 stop:567 length:309 start_codon:yes stop_codon:yes gene_type:complete